MKKNIVKECFEEVLNEGLFSSKKKPDISWARRQIVINNSNFSEKNAEHFYKGNKKGEALIRPWKNVLIGKRIILVSSNGYMYGAGNGYKGGEDFEFIVKDIYIDREDVWFRSKPSKVYQEPEWDIGRGLDIFNHEIVKILY